MKTIKALCLLLFITIVISGCKTAGSNETPQSVVSFEVDGVPAQTSTSADITISYSTSSIPVILISAKAGNNIITLHVLNVQTGTFVIGKGLASAAYSNQINANDTYVANSGQITITKLSDNATSGSFQFISEDLNNNIKTINNGTFTISGFTVQ